MNEIFLLWGSQIVVVLIFVNLVLKNLWEGLDQMMFYNLVEEKLFSPWYEITNACGSNCSFVSGDASVGFQL